MNKYPFLLFLLFFFFFFSSPSLFRPPTRPPSQAIIRFVSLQDNSTATTKKQKVSYLQVNRYAKKTPPTTHRKNAHRRKEERRVEE